MRRKIPHKKKRNLGFALGCFIFRVCNDEGNYFNYLNTRSRNWKVDRPQWAWTKPLLIQQWGILVNSLTAEPATWKNEWQQPVTLKQIFSVKSTLSNKVLDGILIMTFSVYLSWPNYVPAVAVIRKRLVLFIFNRFKGYLDGKSSQDRKGTNLLEYNVRWKYGSILERRDEILSSVEVTGKSESDHLCKYWRWRTKAYGN